MGSNKAPILIVLAGVIAAVALFVVLSGGEDDDGDSGEPAVATTTTAPDEPEPSEPAGEEESTQPQAEPKPKPKPEKPPVPSVEIRNGKPVGGVLEAEFDSGKKIELVITSDAEDELHLHGYDEYIDVGPGRRTRVSVDANIEGIFELESHSTGTLIARISVVP